MTVLIFDSGVGGLSILREVRVSLPGNRIVYVGDDEGFPYGDWQEPKLVKRIEALFEKLISTYQPVLAIVACNTASTLILPSLRNRFDISFVGTVPAIKPAAHRTHSKMISVLGTPGTIKRPYIQNLIDKFAQGVDVNLVPASKLAKLAEEYMLTHHVNQAELLVEIAPCFKQVDNKKTDIVVLGCTHYPFLANEMRKIAPWPVDWLDPAEAIAQRTANLLNNQSADACPDKRQAKQPQQWGKEDIAVMTSGDISTEKQKITTKLWTEVSNSEYLSNLNAPCVPGVELR